MDVASTALSGAHVQVEWVLEVVRFGLALPLSEHEAVRACVRVCCAWLGALLGPAPAAQPPPPAVPPPVRARPRLYARRILHHLQNLFVPRPDDSQYSHCLLSLLSCIGLQLIFLCG
jgi:hypothetical protein